MLDDRNLTWTEINHFKNTIASQKTGFFFYYCAHLKKKKKKKFNFEAMLVLVKDKVLVSMRD
jgi:hypothetical protein